MRQFLAALVLLCLGGPQLLVGQTSDAAARLAPGARVRVTLPNEHSRAAVVVARTRDTLSVRWDDAIETSAVPLARISRLEVSTGRHRSVLKGAVMGGLIGTAAGALLSGATYSPCETSCPFLEPNSRGEATLAGGAGGGVLGFLVGSLVGLRTHEEWERVSLTPRMVSSRGVVAGISLRFAF